MYHIYFFSRPRVFFRLAEFYEISNDELHKDIFNLQNRSKTSTSFISCLQEQLGHSSLTTPNLLATILLCLASQAQNLA